jgi:hypothetical protein
MNRDASARLIPAVVAGVAAGAVLIVASDGALLRIGIVASLLLLLAILSIPTLQRVLLAIAILEIPLQVDIYIGNDPAWFDRGAVSGFNLSVTTFVLVVLYALWAAEAGERHRRADPTGPAAAPTAVYFALVVGSVLVAGEAALALSEVVILAQAILLFWYILHHIRTRSDVMFVVVVLMAGLIVQGIVALGLQIVGDDVVLGPMKADIDDGRVNGTFGSPNVLGSYLTLLLPVAIGLVLSSAGPRQRLLGGVAFGLGLLALVLSSSRGAWIGFTLTMALMLAVAWRRRWLAGTGPLVLGGMAVALAIVFHEEILLRAAEFNNRAARSRLPLMELAFRMIRDAPLTGVGANNFAASLDGYLTVDYSREWISTVHNKYLLVWAETGLAALVAFLWVLLSAIRAGWRQVTAGDSLLSPLALGLSAGLIGNMIHMTVDLFHGRPQVQLLWLVIGVILAILRVVQREAGSIERAKAATAGLTGGRPDPAT